MATCGETRELSHRVIGWERDPVDMTQGTPYDKFCRYMAAPFRIIIATNEGVETVPWVGDIPLEVDLVAGKWVPAT